MTNEFEEMYNKNDFDNSDDAVGETESNSEKQESGEQESADDMIADGNQGLEYDYTKAPDTTKAPERENLDGKTVTIKKAELILPSPEKEWQWTKKKTAEYKPCMFILHYENGQREYYSGVKVFKRKDSNTGKELYSHPQIQNNAENQASKLKSTYAEYKGVRAEEISLKQFLSFLNSKPKALIEGVEFENPETGEKTTKNIVKKFVSE